jgi:hypothetical protein
LNAAPDASARTRRVPVRWSLVLAVPLVLIAIVWLRRAEPDYEARIAPIPVHGRVGERIQARSFSVLVKRAKLAGAYRTAQRALDDAPPLVRPNGIWMSALVEVEGAREPVAISARLRTRDGLLYMASPITRPDIGGMGLQARRIAPGLRVTGAYFFDVPRDRLQGAHLQFYADAVGGIPPGLDHLVDVDLGLDAAAVRKLLAEAPPILDLQ